LLRPLFFGGGRRAGKEKEKELTFFPSRKKNTEKTRKKY
jgi:hypothetical protein